MVSNIIILFCYNFADNLGYLESTLNRSTILDSRTFSLEQTYLAGSGRGDNIFSRCSLILFVPRLEISKMQEDVNKVLNNCVSTPNIVISPGDKSYSSVYSCICLYKGKSA